MRVHCKKMTCYFDNCIFHQNCNCDMVLREIRPGIDCKRMRTILAKTELKDTKGIRIGLCVMEASSIVFARKSFSCSVIPPLENSTYNVHSGIHLKMRTRPVRDKRLSRRTVWRYTHANFEKANRLIESLDMSSILNPNDIDRSWENWRAEFLHIMDKCVPKATLSSQ